MTKAHRSLALSALVFALPYACRHSEGAAAEHEESAPPIRVRCVAATSSSVDVTLHARGRVAPQPGGDLAIASQVQGRIVKLSVREGDAVAIGTIVATVDDVASVAGARQAEAGVAQSRSAYATAQIGLERAKKLVGAGVAPKQELDDAIARTDAAKASLDASLAGAELARRTLGRVAVASAFAGVVTKVFRGEGALVDGTAATPIAQIAAASAVDLVVDVTQGDLASLRVGQAATTDLLEDEKPIAGTVRSVGATLDPATGLGLVRVAMPASSALRIGSFARVSVVVDRRAAKFSLPLEAIRGALSDGLELALCKPNHEIELRTVHGGARTGGRIEIVEGLVDGDRVAIDHVLALESGTKIEVMP